ncbi:MAG: hypothetical protein HYT43_01435 [Candidatus Taylorbacteria bacterium]|nr:hypothetical protein [Candidatus Taylorbacteria bacterium]
MILATYFLESKKLPYGEFFAGVASERKILFRAIFAALGSHLIIKDQKLNIELHNYFKVIFENLPAVEKELLQVRTSENTADKRQIVQVWAKCPTLRCILEIARTEFACRASRGSGNGGE